MSSEISDESMKDDSEAYYSSSIPGSALMQKVGHKVAKTAKKTKKNIKQTQENIKGVAANATSLIERTIQITEKRRLSSFGVSDVYKKSDTSRSAADECGEAAPVDAELEDASDSSMGNEEIPKRNSEPEVLDVRRSGIHTSTKNSSYQEEVEKEPQPETKEEDAFDITNKTSNIEELQPDRLLHNPSVLAVLVALLLSAFKAFSNYSDIWDNNVPIHVALTWAALTLVVGVEIGRIQAAKEFRQYLTLQSTIYEKSRLLASNQPSLVSQNKFNRSRRSSDDREEGEEEYDEDQRHHTSRFRKVLDKVQRRMRRTSWTTLGSDPKRKRQKWERNGNVLVSNSLTKALCTKTPENRRKSLSKLGVSEQELKEAIAAEDESLFVGTGTIVDPERMIARSLEDDAIEPLCRLRGMDVFLTESAETDLAEHPFLIENGLRDRPTFIINVLTQWGNVAIYFELPNWIAGWDDEFTEKEDDPEDVIALKTDEYRNQRFKCLPVLVDGPGPMRYMAPPKETCTVISESLPSAWKFHQPKIENGETILYPCLELESDLMANRSMRAAAALVKRYLGSMVGDVAVLIEKPWGQEEDEPRACLGMCRFDRIDAKTCPEMPPRKEEEDEEEEEGETSAVERDILRASAVLGQPSAITQEECSALRQQPLRQTA